MLLCENENHQFTAIAIDEKCTPVDSVKCANATENDNVQDGRPVQQSWSLDSRIIRGRPGSVSLHAGLSACMRSSGHLPRTMRVNMIMPDAQKRPATYSIYTWTFHSFNKTRYVN